MAEEKQALGRNCLPIPSIKRQERGNLPNGKLVCLSVDSRSKKKKKKGRT